MRQKLLNVVVLMLIALIYFDHTIYHTLLAMAMRISQFLIAFVILLIVFSDFFKALKKLFESKMAFLLKRFKRKVNKTKRLKRL